jgi:bifunctional non-homologous end joining protein LigD
MGLKEYRKKRDFKKTKEPSGEVVKKGNKSKPEKLSFVVQKHAASHLHYDFRLELNGVLLSWAVPKGPSLDPKVKRLAMHVEDHPLDYGGFEGSISKGQYGGGTVIVWDNGYWIPKSITEGKKASFKFTLKGHKLKGDWALVQMRDEQWLLIKEKDKYASDLDITITKPKSVTSKKTIEQVAAAFEKGKK